MLGKRITSLQYVNCATSPTIADAYLNAWKAEHAWYTLRSYPYINPGWIGSSACRSDTSALKYSWEKRKFVRMLGWVFAFMSLTIKNSLTRACDQKDSSAVNRSLSTLSLAFSGILSIIVCSSLVARCFCNSLHTSPCPFFEYTYSNLTPISLALSTSFRVVRKKGYWYPLLSSIIENWVPIIIVCQRTLGV